MHNIYCTAKAMFMTNWAAQSNITELIIDMLDNRVLYTQAYTLSAVEQTVFWLVKLL